jgi:hypothetical protein
MTRVLVLLVLLAGCFQKGDPNKAPTEASAPPTASSDDYELEPDEDPGDFGLDDLDRALDAIEKEVNQ